MAFIERLRFSFNLKMNIGVTLMITQLDVGSDYADADDHLYHGQDISIYLMPNFKLDESGLAYLSSYIGELIDHLNVDKGLDLDPRAKSLIYAFCASGNFYGEKGVPKEEVVIHIKDGNYICVSLDTWSSVDYEFLGASLSHIETHMTAKMKSLGEIGLYFPKSFNLDYMKEADLFCNLSNGILEDLFTPPYRDVFSDEETYIIEFHTIGGSHDS